MFVKDLAVSNNGIYAAVSKGFKAFSFDLMTLIYLGLVLRFGFFSSNGPFSFVTFGIWSGGFFVLACAFLWLCYRCEWETLGQRLFSQEPGSAVMKPQRFHLWSLQMWFLFGLTLVVSAVVTRFSWYDLTDEMGFKGALRLFGGLLNPNWDLLPQALLKIVETVYMAFLATTLAVPVAFVLSFFAAKNVMTRPWAVVIYMVLRAFLNLTRSVESLIWAIVFSVWVGIGPFAGMLALMIHSMASLAKQYSEIVETVQQGPLEAIQSTGAHFVQVVWFGIVPQVVLPFLSFTIYRWDINVRMATVIGLVGGGGIGTMLIKYQGQAQWNEVGCIVFVIAAVVWLMDMLSATLRTALK